MKNRKQTTNKGNGAAPKSTKIRRTPKRQPKTADELMMDAWKYTYQTRDRRLAKP